MPILRDGPDEVHTLQLGRNENKRAAAIVQDLEAQKKAQLKAMSDRGLTTKDPLYIGKVSGSKM
jgi:acyl-CoA dehydrogenase